MTNESDVKSLTGPIETLGTTPIPDAMKYQLGELKIVVYLEANGGITYNRTKLQQWLQDASGVRCWVDVPTVYLGKIQ